MVAEGFGDASFQCGLIVFDDEQGVAVFIAKVLAYLALGEDGVAGDDRGPIFASLRVQASGSPFRRTSAALTSFLSGSTTRSPSTVLRSAENADGT